MAPLPSPVPVRHRPPVVKRVAANDHRPAWAGRGHLLAFTIQLGALVQHSAVLALLATIERAFRADKIAYKPPDAPLLTAVLAAPANVRADLVAAYPSLAPMLGM